MKCIFAVAAVLLLAEADAHSQTVDRAGSIVLAQNNNGTCAGPGEQRTIPGTKTCFPGGTYYQMCLSDGSWGLWKTTFEKCPVADRAVTGRAAAR
jgi:hypothetical protein